MPGVLTLLATLLGCASPSSTPSERFRAHFRTVLDSRPVYSSEEGHAGEVTHTLRYGEVMKVTMRTCTSEAGVEFVRGLSTGADGLPVDAEELGKLEDQMQLFLAELPSEMRTGSERPTCEPSTESERSR